MENKPSIGLVLSGGGVKGLAHIGVIKALEEEGIFPRYISGASAGSIVGAFYAAGYSPDVILQFFKTTPLFSFNNYAYGKLGLLNSDKFYEILKTYFPKDNFESLQKQLYVSATDILVGKTKFFHEGPLINAILASAAFPVVLSPIIIDDILYADGGITNNFPVEPLIGQCDKIIGVYVNPLNEIKSKDLTSSRILMIRAFEIGMANTSIKKFNQCDLVIVPEELKNMGVFSMSHLDDAYEIGYKTTKERMKDIVKLIES